MLSGGSGEDVILINDSDDDVYEEQGDQASINSDIILISDSDEEAMQDYDASLDIKGTFPLVRQF